jgi:hypothetical protein
MDANRNRATEILGTTANQAETTLDRRQARVDELVGQGVSADLAQQQAIDELATDAEHTRTTRTSDATDANTAQDQLDLGYETERGQRGDALLEGEANRQVDRDRLDQTGAASATAAATDIGRLELDTQTAASTEDIAEHGQEMDAAQFIDRLGIDRDRLRVDAASQASDERQATLEATFNAYEKLGFDQASLRNQITAIQTQAELDTTMAAINARLAAAGVDAQTRDSMIKNIISIGGIFAAA